MNDLMREFLKLTGKEVPTKEPEPEPEKAEENVADAAMPEPLYNPLPDWNEKVFTINCPTCGGKFHEGLMDSPDRCRCRRARKEGYEVLAHIDPHDRMTFDTMSGVSEEIATAQAVCRAIAAGKRKRGLLMMGPYGVGKTHVMVAGFRACLSAERVCAWMSVTDLIQKVQDTYSDDDSSGVTKTRLLNSLFSRDVVFLDDLGKERKSADSELILWELIEGLYSRRRTIVVATNILSEAGLRQRYSDGALISRLLHMTQFVAVQGEDRRRHARYE